MRRSLSNVLAISVTIALALTGAVPASAATLSTDVGACPSEQSVMPSTSSSAVNGYLCAQEDHSGDQSIGADKTHSWTQNTNVMYYPQYNCSDTTSSSVTVALAAIFGSATYTATNWLAASLTEDNTRHWSAALLWTLGAGTVTGFNNGCDVSDEVWSNPPQILTVDSMSVTGMPDNNTLTAGQKYTFIATVKPQSATPTVALLLDGVGVAEGSVVNGQATISWTPPVEGSHTLAFAFQGNSTNTGGETTPIRVSIVNGVSTTLNSMTPIAGSATNSATTNVSVTPTTTVANVVILDIDALDSTGSPTKVGKGVLSNGVANVTTTPVAPGGSTHRYVAIVVNSAGATIGQSVPFSWKTVIGTSVDLTGISASPVAGVPYTLSATVSPRENGYIYLYDNGVKVSGTDTSSSPDMYPGEGDTVTYPSLAWTPTSSGSHSLVAKFVPNDSWVLGSQSTSQAVNVASGVVLTISTVTKPTSGSPIASITVSPPTWTGTISLTNNGGAVLSSGTAVNGKLSLSFKPPSASCNCVYLIASTPVPNSTPNIALSNKYKYIFGPQPLSSIGVDKGVSIDERMGVALKQAGLSP
ncbi:MAG: Ig-like domain repeat protein, partial [Candidatus Nanopelagicales bacterium]